MSWVQAIILGMLQGVTEFFPVSSSAHLKLARIFFGIPSAEEQVLFDLFCHLGTLIAVLIFLKREIIDLFQTERKKLGMLCIALLPLIPCYFLLKPLRDFMSQPQYLGICLMATAGILYLGHKIRLRREGDGSLKREIGDALWIGAMQSTALIPGISRSAATISCARVLGWDAPRAVRFSFLLSIPTIVGGNCLELLKLALTSDHVFAMPLSCCMIGLFCSGAMGLVIIRFAIGLAEKGKLKPFAWYCFAVGAIAAYYLGVK